MSPFLLKQQSWNTKAYIFSSKGSPQIQSITNLHAAASHRLKIQPRRNPASAEAGAAGFQCPQQTNTASTATTKEADEQRRAAYTVPGLQSRSRSLFGNFITEQCKAGENLPDILPMTCFKYIFPLICIFCLCTGHKIQSPSS